MALTFNSTSDIINCGNLLSDPETASAYVWINYSSLASNTARVFNQCNTDLDRTGFWVLQNGGGSRPNTLRCVVDYSGTDADAIAANNILTTDKWWFIAITFDGLTHPKIYLGDLAAAAAEVSYQSTASPSGSRVSDGGKAFVIGQNDENIGVPSAPAAAIALVHFIPGRVLSLAEIVSHQRRARPVSESRLFVHLGFPGAGTQHDLSGHGHDGTVTGPTWSAHPPIAMPFDDWQIDVAPYVVSAAPSAFHAAWARGSNVVLQ